MVHIHTYLEIHLHTCTYACTNIYTEPPSLLLYQETHLFLVNFERSAPNLPLKKKALLSPYNLFTCFHHLSMQCHVIAICVYKRRVHAAHHVSEWHRNVSDHLKSSCDLVQCNGGNPYNGVLYCMYNFQTHVDCFDI